MDEQPGDAKPEQHDEQEHEVFEEDMGPLPAVYDQRPACCTQTTGSITTVNIIAVIFTVCHAVIALMLASARLFGD